MTTASVRVAPRTAPSASPAARHSVGGMPSTMTAARKIVALRLSEHGEAEVVEEEHVGSRAWRGPCHGCRQPLPFPVHRKTRASISSVIALCTKTRVSRQLLGPWHLPHGGY